MTRPTCASRAARRRQSPLQASQPLSSRSLPLNITPSSRIIQRLLSLLSLLALLSLSLLSLSPLPPALAHYASPSVADLSIHSVDAGRATVTLPDRRSSRGTAPLAQCTFEYKTSDRPRSAPKPAVVEEETLPKDATAKVDPRELLKKLQGSCITSTADYWSYELCFSRSLKQFHGGDVYWLSRAENNDPSSPVLDADGLGVRMGGGDVCEAVRPPKPREVKVSFGCRESAITPQIASVSEPLTCSYSVQVATALVCTDARYPVLSGVAMRGGPTAPPPAMDSGSEDWFLELVELESPDGEAEPILMCQAYSLEYRATSVKNLKFEAFSLEIKRLQGTAGQGRDSVEELPPEYQVPTARRPARIPLSPANLDVSYGRVGMAQQTEPDYDGSLAFVKVYA